MRFLGSVLESIRLGLLRILGGVPVAPPPAVPPTEDNTAFYEEAMYILATHWIWTTLVETRGGAFGFQDALVETKRQFVQFLCAEDASAVTEAATDQLFEKIVAVPEVTRCLHELFSRRRRTVREPARWACPVTSVPEA